MNDKAPIKLVSAAHQRWIETIRVMVNQIFPQRYSWWCLYTCNTSIKDILEICEINLLSTPRIRCSCSHINFVFSWGQLIFVSHHALCQLSTSMQQEIFKKKGENNFPETWHELTSDQAFDDSCCAQLDGSWSSLCHRHNWTHKH